MSIAIVIELSSLNCRRSMAQVHGLRYYATLSELTVHFLHAVPETI